MKKFKVSIKTFYYVVAETPEDAVHIAHLNLHNDISSGNDLVHTVEELEEVKE